MDGPFPDLNERGEVVGREKKTCKTSCVQLWLVLGLSASAVSAPDLVIEVPVEPLLSFEDVELMAEHGKHIQSCGEDSAVFYIGQ